MLNTSQALAEAAEHQRASRWHEAEQLYREVLQAEPNQRQALYGLAAVCHMNGKFEEAVRYWSTVLQGQPGDPAIYVNLGAALASLRQLDQAIAVFQAGLSFQPMDAQLHYNLGKAFSDAGRFDQAVESYRWAIRCQPNFPIALNNLGNTLVRLREHEEAIACYRQALQLDPSHADAHLNLGTTLEQLGQLDQAVQSIRAALRARPDYPAAESALLMLLNYDPNLTPDALFAEHKAWGERRGAVTPPSPIPDLDPSPDRLLRVGYLSPDFCRHPVAYFLEPILANHDRTKVEAFCYADVPHGDTMTAKLQTIARNWRWVIGLSDRQVAELVRQDKIDILVDLAGHTTAPRLGVFALKPAPVQVSYLGYPNTTGSTAIGYRLSDAIADPPGEPIRHTEELVRLPGQFCCYAPPSDAPEVGSLPAARAGHITFGSLHGLSKLSDRVLDLWAEILRAVPTARLLVARHTLAGVARQRLLDALTKRGVDSARLDLRQLLPREQAHLTFYHEIDISLDPFPWTGHTTACESLWMGVPVVTLRGDRHAGRMVSSVLTSLGLHDLVADAPDAYVRIARELANDRPRLAQLRADLRGKLRSSMLCDGKGFTRALEEAYRGMWRRVVSR